MMNAEQLFSVANLVAMLSWVGLVVLPRLPSVARLVTGLVVPALFAVAYSALMLAHWGSAGGFGSLAAVAALFSNPWILLAGWIHYLAFDLLIGTWELRDARARGVPHALVVPCLFLTFMFGPAGWLLYQVVRAACSRRHAAAAMLP